MTLAPADCDKRADTPSCSAWYIARRLGHAERSPPWIMRQIKALIDNEGFPPPITLYALREREPEAPAIRADHLNPKSRWQRSAVDAWFDGQASAYLSSPLADRAATSRAARDAAEIDRRAGLVAEGRA